MNGIENLSREQKDEILDGLVTEELSELLIDGEETV
jgi:hypothetical protein